MTNHTKHDANGNVIFPQEIHERFKNNSALVGINVL